MSSSIDVYPIRSYLKEILKLHGLATEEDVLAYSKNELLKVTQLNEIEIDEILCILQSSNPSRMYTKNALQLLEHNSSRIPIPSLSNCLDDMLDGGFHTGRMYQLYGEAGSGKTQLCLQLCCTVQIPRLVGGNQASAIYIDCENSFKSERFIEIALATIKRVEKLADTQEQNLTINNMMDNLYIFKCIEPQEFNPLILHQLENVIINKQPKLIIIDSIAYQLRYGNEEFLHFKRKTSIMIAQKLKYLALQYDLCVISVNQIAFDPKHQRITPSLGYYWNSSPFGHLRFLRLNINTRSIQGEKGCYKKNRAYFKIEKDGIRDLENLDIDLVQLDFRTHEREEEIEIIFTQQAELLNG